MPRNAINRSSLSWSVGGNLRRTCQHGANNSQFTADGSLHVKSRRLPAEPIRNDDLVRLVAVADGEDVGTLEGLVRVAEDVVDVDDTLGRIVGASRVWTERDELDGSMGGGRCWRICRSQRTPGKLTGIDATDSLENALLLVAIGHWQNWLAE